MKSVYYCRLSPYSNFRFEGFHAPAWTKWFLWLAGWKPMPCYCHFNGGKP